MSNYTHYALDAAENFGLGLEFCSKFKYKTLFLQVIAPRANTFYYFFFFPQNALMVFEILYYKAPTFCLIFCSLGMYFPLITKDARPDPTMCRTHG